MTAEQFHDALTLLPADLVAQADGYRNRNPKILRWRRFAAMAACFALVLGIGSFGLLVLTPMGASKSTESIMMAADTAAPADAPAAVAPEAMQGAPAEAAPMEVPAAEEAEAARDGVENGALTTASAAGTNAANVPLTPILEAGTVSLTAYRLQWSVPQEDGTTMTMTTDAAHPTEHPDSLPVLDGSQAILPLSWEETPDTVTARCWPLLAPEAAVNAQAREAEITGHGLTLCPGAYIYEITATWPQGTASYAFTATAPEPAQ